MQLVDRNAALWRALAASILVGAGLAGGTANAAETCEGPHLAAQRDRADGRLTRATTALLKCSASSCPEMIQADCVRWLEEVNADQPTVVLTARASDGRALRDVRARIDDASEPAIIDGKAIALDPGPHTFVFEAEGMKAVSIHFVAGTGKKNENVEATFVAPAGEDAEASTESTTAIWALLGAGAGTLGLFAGLAIAGEVEFRDLEEGCAPRCDVDTVDRVRGELIVADVFLGASAALFASALVVYLATPSGAGIASSTLAVGPHSRGIGATLRVRY